MTKVFNQEVESAYSRLSSRMLIHGGLMERSEEEDSTKDFVVSGPVFIQVTSQGISCVQKGISINQQKSRARMKTAPSLFLIIRHAAK